VVTGNGYRTGHLQQRAQQQHSAMGRYELLLPHSHDHKQRLQCMPGRNCAALQSVSAEVGMLVWTVTFHVPSFLTHRVQSAGEA
jgi:hypothetical protein